MDAPTFEVVMLCTSWSDLAAASFRRMALVFSGCAFLGCGQLSVDQAPAVMGAAQVERQENPFTDPPAPDAEKPLSDRELRAHLAEIEETLDRLETKLDRMNTMLLASLHGGVPSNTETGLRKRITIQFPRNTLEKALELVSEELGVPITIIGIDLQLEGITKNQSFGFDERDRPAAEVLAKMMRLANPDDKLVIVNRPSQDGLPRLFLSTKAGVKKRGEVPILPTP